MSAEKAPKINAEVIKLSDLIKPGIKIAKDATVEIDPELYTKTLPEGLTKETVEQVNQHNSNFFAATTHAFGHTAVDHMKKHKDVEVLSASFPLLGKDTWNVGIDRKKTFPNPANPDQPIESYGVVSAKLEINEARLKVGQLKQVKLELGEAALKALA